MTIQALSSLRDQFKKSLANDVGALVRLYERENEGRGRPGDWLRPLKRSAVVLIASNLENFVEELVCGALAHLHSLNVVARRYPEGFRIWRFRSSAHMRNLREDNTKDLIELSFKLYSDVRPLSADELKLDEIRDTFANPIAKNVNWIMSLLDVPDYCSSKSVTVDGVEIGLVSGLGELAKRRNDVAHGNANVQPSIDDVKRLSKFAQLLATRMMRDVESAILRCI